MGPERGRRRWLMAIGAVAATLVLVWCATGISGLLVAGVWPDVSLPGSVVELVRAVAGRAPAAGIPRAVFWLCLVLELAGVARMAVQVRRWRGTARQRTWTPRPVAGEPAGAVSFQTA